MRQVHRVPLPGSTDAARQYQGGAQYTKVVTNDKVSNLNFRTIESQSTSSSKAFLLKKFFFIFLNPCKKSSAKVQGRLHKKNDEQE